MFKHLILLDLLAPSIAVADDWPQWAGPQRDAVWRERGIVRTLPASDQLPRVWSASIAEGYAGPAVADGRVFVSDRQPPNQNERVLCLDAETGDVVWKHEYPARYTISYPAGPRATPLVHDGRVYHIGAVGHFKCLDAKSGKLLWQKHFVNDFGTTLPVWGMAASPLVDGPRLISLVGGADSALIVCFDRISGEELWRAGHDPAVGYCPPMIFEFGGQRQLIVWHPSAVSAFDPETGRALWSHAWDIRYGLCIPTPRQIGEGLFLTSFYNGPLMLRVSADNADVVWKGKSNSELQTDGLHSIMPTPWVDRNRIYGICSYGQLRCLRTSTGERLWETREATGKGRWWNAFLVRHEDRFFIHNEQGELIIAKLDGDGYREISRSLLVEPTRKEARRMTIWSHPAFAMKSVFARNDRELVRVDLSE